MSQERVLVAEDDDLIRSLAVESLRDEGFEVVEAPNGDTALRHIKDEAHFDILFTDVRMPGRLDGIDLVEHARNLDPDLRVVLVSGYAPQLTERLQTLDPPVLFFSKPYLPMEVIAAIRKLLS